MPCCLPSGKAGELQILCCQGIKVNDYNFTLDALALKPSGFCNVGDNSGIVVGDPHLISEKLVLKTNPALVIRVVMLVV